MKIKFCIIICVFLLSCQNKNTELLTNSEQTTENNSDAISQFGYWQIPIESRTIKNDNNILQSGNYLFFLDRNSITLSLWTMKEWMWKSEDDYYKLSSKWNHDSLYYLPPFGEWTFLAKFDGTNFMKKEQNVSFKYEKIKPNNIDSTNLSILKKRELHNYKTKPTNRINR
ncbi:MAG: hypothetical protein PHI36_04105 [Bacteroidales bacterium]|nr:hypothetical protein [Bacteroidales bacterium]